MSTGHCRPIAYLLSRYPAISHTFFLNEIAGLEQLGMRIEVASINPADRAEAALSSGERAAAATTFYLKQQSITQVLITLLRTAIRQPAVLLRGLAAAFRLEPWHLAHTLYALFYLVEAILLGDWMKKRGLAHLHIHFSGPVASVGMIAAAAWRFPYSMTVHGPDEFFDQQETALAQKIGAAVLVICISDYCRSQLMRLLPPTAWGKLVLVRLGVSPLLAAEPLRRNPEPRQILCTGRLVGAKGQAVLIQAMAELVREGHSLLRLVFAGDGPDRLVLERLVDECGLRPHVTFAGSMSHDDVLKALRRADLFILPSFAEGIPVALMEAMAIGVPCISTFVAGIPELIRHEQDGLLVPAGSIVELTEAIERLLMNDGDRQRFQQSARRRVLEHYNLPMNLQLLSATFEAHFADSGLANDCRGAKGGEHD